MVASAAVQFVVEVDDEEDCRRFGQRVPLRRIASFRPKFLNKIPVGFRRLVRIVQQRANGPLRRRENGYGVGLLRLG
jgi:hypothetical protein